MAVRDLILDANYTPTYDEIFDYINEPARTLWRDFNSFVQQKYKVSPKITYSKCSGKPGWNLKYQKSGKSLCTLYPERECFIALIVVTLDLVPVIEASSKDFEPYTLGLLRSARPFNGTLWLMVRIENKYILENVKHLLLLKQAPPKIH
ncbi:MAG: DUF3788 domain-containing protein [Peptococcaceae bacterium]|nr:DUF3788 domain-containing protein [Peptococcaceae bacterium]